MRKRVLLDSLTHYITLVFRHLKAWLFCVFFICVLMPLLHCLWANVPRQEETEDEGEADKEGLVNYYCFKCVGEVVAVCLFAPLAGLAGWFSNVLQLSGVS